jgi:DNA-directed RNA polymerase specialized sigma54-like protein
MEGNYKNMENDFKLLQADKFKHEKITTIISEEKDLAKNDINKLKKEVEKRDQKEEQYLTDVKALKEQITKLEMKNAFLTKEYDKFKASLTESVKSAISVKQNYFPTVENISHMEGSKILQRSRFTRNPGSASDVSLNLSGASEIKLGEAIEGVAKEAQITIASLN